jgi:site-specific DNA-methyltransferase (adenine-specific)
MMVAKTIAYVAPCQEDSPVADQLNKIHLGDCIAGMKKLGKESVDLAFADPPFNIGYDYDVYDDKKEHAEYLKWSREWIAAVYKVLKPDGTFWLAIGDEYAAELKIISQEVGFHSRSWVIWYYTFGVNCKQKFTRSHAHLFHFVKDPAKFTFRGDELENRVPSARQLVYADARANSTGRLPDDTWILRPQDMVEGFTPGEDTWYIPRVAGTFKERAGFHGCQMPEQLLGRIIRTCSHENEVVLDPFSGSATTLATAKKLGRQFVGFDLSKEYVKQGRERLKGIRRGDRLNGDPEPQVSPALRQVKENATNKERKAAAAAAKASNHVENSRLVAITKAGLVEAFRRTCDGYSVDRVIADPELNLRFTNECDSLGLAGDPRSWNHSLFRLRKSGELAAIPAHRRTMLSLEECNRYLFASEIAWQKMLNEGCTGLDAILCDPRLAERFDAIARAYAPHIEPPADFSDSLCFRWAAFKLRKEAKDAADRAQVLHDPLLSKETYELDGTLPKTITAEAGLYLVEDAATKSTLYVGQTLNLQEQFAYQFTAETLQVWRSEGRELFVRVAPLQTRFAELHGYQSKLIKNRQPKLNYNYYYSPDREGMIGA